MQGACENFVFQNISRDLNLKITKWIPPHDTGKVKTVQPLQGHRKARRN